MAKKTNYTKRCNIMGELQEMLIQKREELNLSLREASNLIGISHSYLSTLEKGIDPRTGAPIKPTPETLKLISEAYNIDYYILMKAAGYLEELDKTDIQNPEKMAQNKLTEKDKRDIAKDLEKMMNDLEHADGLLFYNEPITNEDRELLKQALEFGLRLAKIKNKEKYTPKKYRK